MCRAPQVTLTMSRDVFERLCELFATNVLNGGKHLRVVLKMWEDEPGVAALTSCSYGWLEIKDPGFGRPL